jgi:hypothetical protein
VLSWEILRFNDKDLSEYPDFETMQNRVAEAHSLFEDLPAEVRFKFDNKPAELLKFMRVRSRSLRFRGLRGLKQA